jgi:hypothetical protein
MKSQKNESLDSFDRESFKTEFEDAIPEMIAEMSDLLERRPLRVSRRDRRELAEGMTSGIEVSIPHLKTLEGINGDLSQIDKGYNTLEELLWAELRQANVKVRLKPGEDLFGYFLRTYWKALRSPYRLKRLKQYRIVREGIETLVLAVINHPGGENAARQLIEEFERKHLKEYMRCANALDARINSYRNINLMRMTHQNVTRLSDVYRDAAAAFEKRLRLLVGLNYIVRGEAKTYDELRRLGYNGLLQAVGSPNNPLLHFLQESVDRNVRNALMHAGVSSSLSKETVKFSDYSPQTKKETEIEWTMSKFFRRTTNLILTIHAVGYLEHLFNYARSYRRYATVHYLRINPPSNLSVAGVK